MTNHVGVGLGKQLESKIVSVFHTLAGLQSGPLKGPSLLPALSVSWAGAAFAPRSLGPGPSLEQRPACGLHLDSWIPPGRGQASELLHRF